MERLLLLAATLYLLYFLLRTVLIFFNFWVVPFQRARFMAQEKLPETLAPLFQAPQEQLHALGFAEPQPVLVTNVIGQPGWALLLRHEAGAAYALLGLKPAIDVALPFGVTFYSLLPSGAFVETVNGEQHLILGEIPDSILKDGYTPELSAHWQLHQETVAMQTEDALRLAPHAFLEKLQDHYDAYLQRLIDGNKLRSAGEEGRRHPTAAAALEMTVKFMRGGAKANKLRRRLLANARQGEITRIEIPVEMEVQSFHALRNLQRRKLGRQWKIWLVGVTLVLFIISFLQLVEPQIVLILLGVLLLHEAGHWLAMRATGYKNQSFFFIPFLGAAVTGEKSQATSLEQMVVLLAGPVPGLALGLGIQWWLNWGSPSSIPFWLSLTSVMLIVINLLNLLPLYPLDGGQIVNLLFFTRRPYADFIFKLAAVAAFAAAALWLREVILGVVAGWVLLGMRSSFRLARVFSRIDPARLRDVDENGRIHAGFQALRDAGYTHLTFGNKFHLVKALLNRSWNETAARGQRLLLAGIYLVLLVGGFAFFTAAF